MSIVFSAIVPVSAKDLKSQMLQDLIASIKAQDFPQDQIEILIMGPEHGDSEQAKAAGIRQAKGEICVMLCSDNEFLEKDIFSRAKRFFDRNKEASGVYPMRYSLVEDDNSLNRYFALIGGNDPICYYLGKNDRSTYVLALDRHYSYPFSFGCNGTFYRSEHIKITDLDHYYPMDNATEVPGKIYQMSGTVWHKTTDGNLFTFLRKRYRYARDLYCDRQDRRWKIIETIQDKWRLFFFGIATLTVIQPFSVSVLGFCKVRDWAWFWHWPVCFGFLITYTLLAIRNLIKYKCLFQKPALSSQVSTAKTA